MCPSRFGAELPSRRQVLEIQPQQTTPSCIFLINGQRERVVGREDSAFMGALPSFFVFKDAAKGGSECNPTRRAAEGRLGFFCHQSWGEDQTLKCTVLLDLEDDS